MHVRGGIQAWERIQNISKRKGRIESKVQTYASIPPTC